MKIICVGLMNEANQIRNEVSFRGELQFPRTQELPVQSPIYWVNQKDRYLRQLLIRDIEALTKRRLFVYFANRFCRGSDIDEGDPAYLCELFSDYAGDEPMDLLLETNGGKTDSTEALVSILKNRVPDLRVVVANAAKSNGTLLCLAANSIVMGCASELGPVDPHLEGTPCTILADPQLAAMNFALHKLAILFLKQTQKLTSELLRNGMMQGRDESDIQDVTQKLSTRDYYFSHGSTIDYKEAQELGLKVEILGHESEIWKRIWMLYSMYDFDCRRDGYVKVFESRSRSTAIKALNDAT